MITVRFPEGQAIQYNDANYVVRALNYTDIYTKKDGAWIAQVPNTALIEIARPCAITNPLTRQAPEQALITVEQHIRALPGHKVAALKKLLRGFNARSQKWI